MARPESQALGGYFATPPQLIPAIAALVDHSSAVRLGVRSSSTYHIIDPCAGTGDALYYLVDQWWPSLNQHHILRDKTLPTSPRLYGCELEAGRYEEMKRWADRVHTTVLHGDAFRVSWGAKAAGHVLYLNPPYDVDREVGRLEHRFLQRFTNCLMPGQGILLYVVPYYALAASATFIAEQYDDVFCFRFPEPEYQVFRQVVLVAKRRKTADTFAAEVSPIKKLVEGWAADDSTIPVLPEHPTPVVALPDEGVREFEEWVLRDLDVGAMCEGYTPWRNTYGLGLELNIDQLIGSRFPVVMPPKPVHAAIALSTGQINGRPVKPNYPDSNLPTIVVKGIYTRDYKTVEEKKNKDGELVAAIQVEQPKLSVSVLDMEQWVYYDLKQGTSPSGSTTVADMNIADLLKHYGLSLAQLMREQCPPLHDPAQPVHKFQLPELAQRPFHAQADAIMAQLKMLFTKEQPFAGELPMLLGSVGTGKTCISLAVVNALSHQNFEETRQQLAAMGIGGGRAKPIKRVLVVCPPHLLTGWRKQIMKFVPGARVEILASVSDVLNGRLLPTNNNSAPGGGLTIFLISKEKSKLGHAWGDARRKGYCPTCGTLFELEEGQTVEKRMWCRNPKKLPQNDFAKWATKMAEWLQVASNHYHLYRFEQGRYARRLSQKIRERVIETGNASLLQNTWEQYALRGGTTPLATTPFGGLLDWLYGRMLAWVGNGELSEEQIAGLEGELELVTTAVTAFMHPDRDQWIADFVKTFYPLVWQVGGSRLENPLQKLVYLMDDVKGPLQMELVQFITKKTYSGHFLGEISRLHYQRHNGGSRDFTRIGRDHTGKIYVGRLEVGSLNAAEALFMALNTQGEWKDGRRCNTPLFQALPQPRRVALSDVIAKKAPDLFDFLIVDEAHEYSHEGTAQERSAHRLAAMGKPVMMLTGTSNNGYASSMFANMWAMSGLFRRSFGRDGLMNFVNQYGYRKVKVEPDDEDYERFARRFGRVTDAVTGGAEGVIRRKIGEAAGIHPAFIFNHMLPGSILIHQDDMDIELPPPIEKREAIIPTSELQGRHDELLQQIVDTIKRERSAKTEMAERLWWAIAQLPSYLDRAHEETGNYQGENGRLFAFRYPAVAPKEKRGLPFAVAEPFASGVILPKEQWMLDKVSAELRQNRPVILFVYNTGDELGLPNRLYRLIRKHVGDVAIVLDSKKVKPEGREEWLDQKVIGRKKVLITNPKAVETGLNNLVYFSTALWYQNPNCSSTIYRQANGRIRRPGQEADEVRFFVPYYAQTSQEAQLDLLALKIRAAQQADGIDIESALVAAGAGSGEDDLAVMEVGRAIYELLMGNGRQVAPPITKPHTNNGVIKPKFVFPQGSARGQQLALWGRGE